MPRQETEGKEEERGREKGVERERGYRREQETLRERQREIKRKIRDRVWEMNIARREDVGFKNNINSMYTGFRTLQTMRQRNVHNYEEE